ncbi:MAG: hypothetical protein ACLQVI_14785 [Polyangiaceae bacterium]|jgi:hypothetical protein
MLLQTNLTRADLGNFLKMLTPLVIRLSDPGGPLREIVVAPPDTIELVPGRGLRIVTTLALSWTVAGVEVPIHARSAQLLLLPAIVVKEAREALVFSLLLEAIDVRHVPGFLDGPILDRINKVFAEEDATLTWNFLKTLSFGFEMPPRMTSVTRIGLAATRGSVTVSEEAIHLEVSLEALVLHPTPPRES